MIPEQAAEEDNTKVEVNKSLGVVATKTVCGYKPPAVATLSRPTESTDQALVIHNVIEQCSTRYRCQCR